jgi:hypothetical protein
MNRLARASEVSDARWPGTRRRNRMRIILALPLLAALAACNVERDAANDSTTLEFNEERIGEAADDVGNAVESAGEAIQNEVEAVDVDLDVNRNGSGNSN